MRGYSNFILQVIKNPLIIPLLMVHFHLYACVFTGYNSPRNTRKKPMTTHPGFLFHYNQRTWGQQTRAI